MSDYSKIFYSKDFIYIIPQSLFTKYQHISIDPDIQSGMPHIKGTRITVLDVFLAQLEGNSIESMIFEYKKMGIDVSRKQLLEAFEFAAEAISKFTNGKRAKKTRR